MIFRQLFDSVSGTYSYLLASRAGGEALIIDPVLEKVDRYIKLCNELDLRLVKAVDTHLHADHITGLAELRVQIELAATRLRPVAAGDVGHAAIAKFIEACRQEQQGPLKVAAVNSGWHSKFDRVIPNPSPNAKVIEPLVGYQVEVALEHLSVCVGLSDNLQAHAQHILLVAKARYKARP